MRQITAKWTIQKQMVVSILFTTLTIQLIIISIVYNQLQISFKKTQDSLSSLIYSNTYEQVDLINRKSLDTIISVGESIKILGDLQIGYAKIILQSPTGEIQESKTYEQLVQNYPDDFFKNTDYYNDHISYKHSSLFFQDNSINAKTQKGKDWIEKTSTLHQYYQKIVTPYYTNRIQRFMLCFYNKEGSLVDNIIRVYPAQKINPSYNFITAHIEQDLESWYFWTKTLKYQKTFRIGPYIDTKSLNSQEGLTASSQAILDPITDEIICIANYETKSSSLHQQVKGYININYLINYYFTDFKIFPHGQNLLIQSFGTMLYSLDNYKMFFDKQTPLIITNNLVYKLKDFTGMSYEVFKDMQQNYSHGKQYPLTEIQIYNDRLEKVPQYITGIFITDNEEDRKEGYWEYAFFLIFEKKYIKSILDKVETIIYKDHEATITSYANFTIIMLGILIFSCFNFSLKISQPLQKIIILAQQINQNQDQKDFIPKIKNQLPKADYEVQGLVNAFKKLIEIMENNISESKIKQKQILQINQKDTFVKTGNFDQKIILNQTLAKQIIFQDQYGFYMYKNNCI